MAMVPLNCPKERVPAIPKASPDEGEFEEELVLGREVDVGPYGHLRKSTSEARKNPVLSPG
jgi:hypothetical protein